MEAGNQGAATAPKRPAGAPLPLWTRIQLAGLTAAIDAVERDDGTVNRCLYGAIDRLLSARADPRPDKSGVRSYDVTMDASRGIWARVFAPVSSADNRPLPVVVYYHGGGFALFSPAIGPFNGVCRRLCAALGAVVVSVNYRLAPEHRWPAAYDDGVDALRFIDDAGGVPGLDAEVVPVDLASCFLAGESAGGNIVHHVANRWAGRWQASARCLRVAGIFPVQPYFGGVERTESELALEGAAPVVNLKRSDFSCTAFLPVGATRDHPAVPRRTSPTRTRTWRRSSRRPWWSSEGSTRSWTGSAGSPVRRRAAAEGERRGGGGVPGHVPRVLWVPGDPRGHHGVARHEGLRRPPQGLAAQVQDRRRLIERLIDELEFLLVGRLL